MKSLDIKDTDPKDDYLFLDLISNKETTDKPWTTEIRINCQKCTFKIDT
jgi:hypothetical protein